MARGEVRYRLTLDGADFQKEAANAGKAFAKLETQGGKFADSVGRVSTQLARAGDTMGLPTKALRALDDAMDVTELGLNNLSKATAGFTAASVGAAGAGFAIGTMLGNWLREIPAVANWTDTLASKLAYLATGITDVERAGAALDVAKMGGVQQDVLQRTITLLHSQGVSLEDIKSRYRDLPPAVEKWLESLDKQEKASKKIADERREYLDVAAQIAKAEAEIRLEMERQVRLAGLMGGPPTSMISQGPINLGKQFNLGTFEEHVPGLRPAPFVMQTEWPWKPDAINDAQDAVKAFDAALANLAHTFQVVGIGPNSIFGRVLSTLTLGRGVGGFKGIGALFSGLGKEGGIDKFLAGLPGLAGIGASIFGIGKSIIGKLFGGGPSKAEREAAAKKAAEEAAAAAAALAKHASESRARGVGGILEFGPRFFMQRTIADAAEAQRQGALFAAAWGQVVREKGIVAAADAFKDAFAKMKADMEAAGLDKPGWFTSIEGLMTVGLDEEFRNIAEAAHTAAQFLKALGEAGALGEEAFRIFEQEARRAFAGGKEAAIRLGLGEEQAIKAGFGAANPLLKELLNQSVLSRVTLSADIQEMINAAGIVPDVDFQQLDELRKIRAAVEKLAGVTPGTVPREPGDPNAPGLTPEEREQRREERTRRGYQHGGYVYKTGLAYLHAGERVIPALPIEPGGGGGWAPGDSGGGFVPSEPGGGGSISPPEIGQQAAAITRTLDRLARTIERKPTTQVVSSSTIQVDVDPTRIPRNKQDFFNELQEEIAKAVRIGNSPLLRAFQDRGLVK